MNICVNVDKNYLRHLYVLLLSLFINNASDSLVIHVIKLGDFDEEALRIFCAKFGVQVYFYDVSHLLEGLCATGRFTPAIFGRLLIPELVKVDEVTYLDIDMYVTNSLSKLCDMKIGDGEILAVEEADSRLVKRLKAKYELDTYFNAGMFKVKIGPKTRASFKEAFELASTGVYEYHDQDVLNIAFRGQFSSIDTKYNYMGYVKQNHMPYIIHYAHSKPWDKFCFNAYQYKYLSALGVLENILPSSQKYPITIKSFIKFVYFKLKGFIF